LPSSSNSLAGYSCSNRSSHSSHARFKDGINRMNQDLLASFARHQVEIPFPTQMEVQKD
jgi:hypothetical protein